jgi:hypothetical protein
MYLLALLDSNDIKSYLFLESNFSIIFTEVQHKLQLESYMILFSFIVVND